MKRSTEPTPLYLASSVTENTLVANSVERLNAVLTALEQCRTVLTRDARPESAKLLSLAILQLRMELNHVAEPELKALCEALTAAEAVAEASHDPTSPQAQSGRAQGVLKLVK